jgi:hypothetical protein
MKGLACRRFSKVIPGPGIGRASMDQTVNTTNVRFSIEDRNLNVVIFAAVATSL